MHGESLDLKGKSGIYLITCIANGRKYVGSSRDLDRRRREHSNDLKRGNHGNSHLLNAYRKYGEDCFSFTVLEYCDESVLIEREQWYIDSLDTVNSGFNIAPFADRPVGITRSPEMCVKISKALTGKKLSKEHRQAISRAHKGKKLSEEQCAKLRGRTVSSETREKLRIASSKRVHSDATKQKLREKHLGEKNGMFGVRGKDNPSCKAVIQMDMQGNELARYVSLAEANEVTGVNFRLISRCCRGERKHTCGYRWEFAS
jgi:group I intron endonuclease